QMRAVRDVEGADVVRQVHVVGAGTLDGGGIVDVEDGLVRRESQPVRLVERIGDDRRLARRRIVPVDEIAHQRRVFETLQIARTPIRATHRTFTHYPSV